MPLYQLVAAVLCLILAGLAALHLYWAAGGRHALQGAVPTVDGRPLFSPGPLSTFAVAAALAAAAAIAAVRGDLLSLPLPAWLAHFGTWALGIVFALRAVGEFRYVGFFKRVRGSVFARRDTLVYSPLCAFLSALAVVLAVLAP